MAAATARGNSDACIVAWPLSLSAATTLQAVNLRNLPSRRWRSRGGSTGRARRNRLSWSDGAARQRQSADTPQSGPGWPGEPGIEPPPQEDWLLLSQSVVYVRRLTQQFGSPCRRRGHPGGIRRFPGRDQNPPWVVCALGQLQSRPGRAEVGSPVRAGEGDAADRIVSAVRRRGPEGGRPLVVRPLLAQPAAPRPIHGHRHTRGTGRSDPERRSQFQFILGELRPFGRCSPVSWHPGRVTARPPRTARPCCGGRRR